MEGNELILVLDFGSLHKELIARCVRSFNVYSEIRAGNLSVDKIKELNPKGIILTGGTDNTVFADKSVLDLGVPVLGVDYGTDLKYCLSGIEIARGSENGKKIIKSFLFDTCGVKGDYSIGGYIKTSVAAIQAQVGKEKVMLALSGGVDSSVCASLLSKAVPGQLTCIFVDHGLMRLNEGDEVEAAFKHMDLNFIRINAEERFLSKLRGVTEPEQKRKIVGSEFIKVFQEEAAKHGDIKFLAQGTIYPDIVESGGAGGAVIKSHHNVGGLPENMNFTGLVEPLSGLFKDEVRVLGRQLGLPKAFVERQPFPGPGLCVRVMGEVTKEKLDILRAADAIFREEVGKLRKRPNQYFTIYTGVRSVGIANGKRVYDGVIALRAVDTIDYMTCEYTKLSYTVLTRVAGRIIKEVPGAGRVVYDITAKPPGTIEWE